MAMSTWPIPKQYADTTLWASGNQTSCNVQGVFTQGATIMSVLYYGTLATYVLLVVRFGVRERSIERFEWYFHVIPIVFGAGTGIATVPLQITNNANLWCFIAPNTSDPDRLLSPEEANTYRMVFFYGPLFVVTLFLTINMVVVAMFVRRLTTKAILASTFPMNADGSCGGSNASATNRSFFGWRRRQLPRILERSIGDDDEDDDDDDSIDVDDDEHDDEAPQIKGPANFPSAEFSFDSTIGDSSRRSNRYAIWRRKISRQNLCFTLAFYFTWTPISVSYTCHKVVENKPQLTRTDIEALLTVFTLRSHFSSSLTVLSFLKTKVVRLLQLSNNIVPFWLLTLATITTPMQGLPNLIAMFYPKYRTYIQKTKGKPAGNFVFYRWLMAGAPSDVVPVDDTVRGEDQQLPIEQDDITRPNGGNDIVDRDKSLTERVDNETNEGNGENDASEWSPERRLGAISSITISCVEQPNNTNSTLQGKWTDSSNNQQQRGLKIPTRFVSEASCSVKRVSFQEDDVSSFSCVDRASFVPSNTNRSTPSSILKVSSQESVSTFVSASDDPISNGEGSSRGIMESPQNGDKNRWVSPSRIHSSDQLPTLPRRVYSTALDEGQQRPEKISSDVSPNDKPPGVPRRLQSEHIIDDDIDDDGGEPTVLDHPTKTLMDVDRPPTTPRRHESEYSLT